MKIKKEDENKLKELLKEETKKKKEKLDKMLLTLGEKLEFDKEIDVKDLALIVSLLSDIGCFECRKDI